MTTAEAKIGTRVRTIHAWSLVPVNTEGVIDEYYEFDNDGLSGGWMVAWDLPDQPLPKAYREFTGDPAIRSRILRDGFNEKELCWLEVVNQNQTKKP